MRCKEEEGPGKGRRGGFVASGQHGEELVSELVVGEVVGGDKMREDIIVLRVSYRSLRRVG